MMHKDKSLIIIGFCSGALPVVTEMAHDILELVKFDIVKNVVTKAVNTEYIREDFHVAEHSSDNYTFNLEKSKVFFGVLDSHIKYILFHYFQKKHGIDPEHYLSLKHPLSYFSKSSIHETGFLIEPIAIVSSFCKIGFGVTIKRNSSVGHHVILGDFVSINPGVNISGNVTIGDGATIGTGTSVVNNIKIGKYSLIGAGSVVTKDIPDGVVAYGNPCRIARKNERWNKVFDMLSNDFNQL
jgi:sugar O-acyltransferase (sialic acid O-acetyltransferase NeuD family)